MCVCVLCVCVHVCSVCMCACMHACMLHTCVRISVLNISLRYEKYSEISHLLVGRALYSIDLEVANIETLMQLQTENAGNGRNSKSGFVGLNMIIALIVCPKV